MIDRAGDLPLTRQCDLVGVARSSLYYRPAPVPQADLDLMARIDRIHLDHPSLGSRRIVDAWPTTGPAPTARGCSG